MVWSITAGVSTSLRRGLSYFPAVALLVVLSLTLMSCTLSTSEDARADQGTSEIDNNLIIVTSVYAAYDFSRTITGENAHVSFLLPPGVEPHSFEPSPTDIHLLNRADILICAGGDSDTWLDKILATLDNPDLRVIKMCDLVETQVEVAIDETATDEHEVDVHVWTSLRNAQIIVEYLASSFAGIDSQNAGLFQANARELIDQLVALDVRITKIVENAKRTTVIFGDRFPFRYFATDYGLTWYAAFSGCSTAVDTDPKTLVGLIEMVHAHKTPAVFYLELSNQRIARTISEETGAEMLLFHSIHTVSKDDFEAGLTYLDLMQSNADNLEVALN